MRVPAVDGAAAEPETVQRTPADSSLLNALQELSNLPSSTGVATKELPATPAEARRRRAPLHSAGTTTSVQKNAMRIVPLSAATPVSLATPAVDAGGELEESPPDEDAAPLIVPDLVDPEIVEEPGTPEEFMAAHPAMMASDSMTELNLPNHLSTALEELAGYKPRTTVSAHESDVRRSGTGLWMALVVVTAVAAFAAGYIVARTSSRPSTGLIPATNAGATEKPGPPAAGNQAGPIDFISGTIMYSEGSGASKPDTESLILLLPSANAAGLKLDARPLRDLQKSPAKEAVEVALRVLGATMTRAAADGTFTLERRHSGPASLIFVSRHSLRADSEPIKRSVASMLAEWFESPSHLIGRLSVEEQVLPAVKEGTSQPPVEITFGE